MKQSTKERLIIIGAVLILLLMIFGIPPIACGPKSPATPVTITTVGH